MYLFIYVENSTTVLLFSTELNLIQSCVIDQNNSILATSTMTENAVTSPKQAMPRKCYHSYLTRISATFTVCFECYTQVKGFM